VVVLCYSLGILPCTHSHQNIVKKLYTCNSFVRDMQKKNMRGIYKIIHLKFLCQGYAKFVIWVEFTILVGVYMVKCLLFA
jgi:hypothetical protein